MTGDIHENFDNESTQSTPTQCLHPHKTRNHGPLACSSFPTPTAQSPLSQSPYYTRSQDQSGLTTPLMLGQDDKDKEIRKLQRLLADTCAQRDVAEVHAVMAQRASAVWQFRFNKKKEKATNRESTRIHTLSRVVSNEQGLVEAHED